MCPVTCSFAYVDCCENYMLEDKRETQGLTDLISENKRWDIASFVLPPSVATYCLLPHQLHSIKISSLVITVRLHRLSRIIVSMQYSDILDILITRGLCAFFSLCCA